MEDSSNHTSDEEKIGILRKEMINEMVVGLDHVDMLLEKSKENGILGAIKHSVEKFVFKYFARDTVKDKSIKQMEIIFKAGKEHKDGAQILDLGRKYFKEYLHNDETYHRCDKKHPKFSIIVDNIKKSFESRIIMTSQILLKGSGSSYKDLVLTSFKNKEEGKKYLAKELDYVKNEIDVLTSNPEILKVPFARDRILDIIVQGYEYAVQRVNGNLDAFYG
ncbi:MAG: hypothetical protein ACFFCS_15830 [Candidatus Hodarchaeota archaeon]